MAAAGIPSAASLAVARPPCVVKADGLAAGKGVHVCRTEAELEAALRAVRPLGGAFVVEELLEGPEVSLLALCDGQRGRSAAPGAGLQARVRRRRRARTPVEWAHTRPCAGLGEAEVAELVDTIHRPVLGGARPAGRAVRRRPVRGSHAHRRRARACSSSTADSATPRRSRCSRCSRATCSSRSPRRPQASWPGSTSRCARMPRGHRRARGARVSGRGRSRLAHLGSRGGGGDGRARLSCGYGDPGRPARDERWADPRRHGARFVGHRGAAERVRGGRSASSSTGREGGRTSRSRLRTRSSARRPDDVRTGRVRLGRVRGATPGHHPLPILVGKSARVGHGSATIRRQFGSPRSGSERPRRSATRIAPVIARYSRPEMTRVWSEEAKLESWLAVELAAIDAWAQVGMVPGSGRGDPRARGGSLSRPRWREIEATTQPRRRRLRGRRRRRARPGRPLVPLRPDVVGRAGHRALADDPGGRQAPPRRPSIVRWKRCVARAEEHRDDLDDRADARRPRRADDVRAQACGLGVPARPRPALASTAALEAFASGSCRAPSGRTRRRRRRSSESRASLSVWSRHPARRRSSSGTGTPSS